MTTSQPTPWNPDESYGGWLGIPSSFTAEIIGRAGFDWVAIDMQHGFIGPTDLVPMLQALDATGTPTLVRVPWNETWQINAALDAGAGGVIIPMVNTGAEAARAGAACRYAPAGRRSMGPYRAVLRDPGQTAAIANDTIRCLVQIETAEALENLDEIAAAPGVDGLFLGPSDLALSIGTPLGDVRDETLREATRRVVKAAEVNGLIAAMYCLTVEGARIAKEDGFKMFAVQGDIRFLRAAAADALEQFKAGQRL